MAEDYLRRCNKPLRGVLESSYLTPPEVRPNTEQQMFSVLSVKYEQAALCGGQICAWCLEAIAFEKGPHHITGSTERCKCTNYKNQNRTEFGVAGGFQCCFFLNEKDETFFRHFSAFLERPDAKSQRNARNLYLHITTEIYPLHHSKFPPEKFLRVVNYCAEMTRYGIKCGLDGCNLRLDARKIMEEYKVPMITSKDFEHFACQGCVYEMQRMANTGQYVRGCEDLTEFLSDMTKDECVTKNGGC